MKKAAKIGLIALAAPAALALCAVLAFLTPAMLALPATLITMPFSPPAPQASIGEYRRVAFCEHVVFSDSTTYAEYVYEQPSFEDNPYFRPVTAEDREVLLEFADDFEGWVAAAADNTDEDARALYQSYGYDSAALTEDDYFYLETEDPDCPFTNYALYIFDSGTNTLYYMESVL